jgi:DNA-binding response OmpR family regulator
MNAMLTRDSKILIVNDDAATRYLWGRTLRDAGYQVREAEAALQTVRTERPHLVLLDVKLPDIDGFIACQHIKSLDSSVPILMVSAWFTSEEDFLTGIASGADAYLNEGTEDHKLLAMIYGLLRRYRTLQAEPPELELQRQNEELRDQLHRMASAHAGLLEDIADARVFEEAVTGRELKLIEYEKEIQRLRLEVQSLKDQPRRP